jgi:polysaccharide pyruvyl transferase WcaK-like protein
LQYLKGIGFHADNDRVYPDLVFSLPVAVIPFQHVERRGRPVVGLGLMAYLERISTPRPSNAIYPAYLETLTTVVRWLLAQENDIRLLVGDLADVRTTQELRALLRKQLSAFDIGRIVDEPVLSVKDLLSQIAATDIVVATRFHNVLLALLCEKPVISISFHHKCKSLMNSMGLSTYCLDIKDLKADQLINKICDMKANAAELKLLIREKNSEFRKALDEQYRFIFNQMA